MPEPSFSRDVLRLDAAAVTDQLAASLRGDIHRSSHRNGAIVGVSGGVDSALTLGLCARALGPSRVTALMMPEAESSPASAQLGKEVADHFGVESVVEDITAALKALGCYERRGAAIRRVFPDFTAEWRARITLPGSALDSDTLNVFHLTVIAPDGTEQSARLGYDEYLQIVAASNLKQRTRMTMLYHHAESRNYCVAGTSNLNEYDQGFFVKYGDGACDVAPIRHLYKTQIYQLAEHLGVPESILQAVPTTDTYSAPTSQEEFFFRMPFEIMDLLMFAREHEVPAATVAGELGLDVEQVERGWADLARKHRATVILRAEPQHYG